MSSQRPSIHSIHNKKFWTEFFYLYESLPALWDMNSPLYKNRQVKSDAYDIMVDKLREIEPNADREDVLRKINIFRTNFRRECTRINMSLQEGRYYQSTLWYFDLLCFLQTSDTRRDRKRKIDDDGEKSIMRKRRTTNMLQKSNDQFLITPKKEQLIEYQPHPTQDYEYDLEEDPDFDYVPDELTKPLADDKNDSSSEIRQNPLALNSYQGVDENDEDDQSQQEYHHQDYTLQRNIQTNNKKIKLTANEASRLGEEINTNEPPLEINDASEDQQIFHDYTGSNESETLQATQWCVKPTNAQNSSTIQIKKTGLHASNTATTQAIKFNDSASTKFVRDVKTMTLNNSHGNCRNKLSESSEIVAKSWAVQYDELSQDQKVLARKAINDILFEGCMGHLGLGSNGRVTIHDTSYKNRTNTKDASNQEVESGEIYEQSKYITATSSFSTSGQAPVALAPSASSIPKDPATNGWLKP